MSYTSLLKKSLSLFSSFISILRYITSFIILVIGFMSFLLVVLILRSSLFLSHTSNPSLNLTISSIEESIIKKEFLVISFWNDSFLYT